MIERNINRKISRRCKTLLAALAAVMIITLSEPVKVLAADISYAIAVEDLLVTEPDEISEYGAVKTADGNDSTAIWLAVLLLGFGVILDRVYLSDRKGQAES